ncbi:MAG: hypothetical protein ACX94B_16965 [Henriciella sp.]
MSELMPRVLSICILFLFWALGAAADKGEVPPKQGPRACSTSGVHQGFVFLCGSVDQSMLQVAEENLTLKGRNKVVIESIGGQSLVANRIGQLLHRDQSEVFVGRRCYSACAQLLLMVPNVTVLPWTEIGFHHNTIAYLALKEDLDKAGVELNWQAIDLVADRTEFSFDLVGANPDILLGGLDRLGFKCRKAPITQDEDGTNLLVGFYYDARFEYWVPTRLEMNRARSEPLKGWWPSSWLDVAISSLMNGSRSNPFRTTFGNQQRFRGSAENITIECD